MIIDLVYENYITIVLVITVIILVTCLVLVRRKNLNSVILDEDEFEDDIQNAD